MQPEGTQWCRRGRRALEERGRLRIGALLARSVIAISSRMACLARGATALPSISRASSIRALRVPWARTRASSCRAESRAPATVTVALARKSARSTSNQVNTGLSAARTWPGSPRTARSALMAWTACWSVIPSTVRL